MAQVKFKFIFSLVLVLLLNNICAIQAINIYNQSDELINEVSEFSKNFIIDTSLLTLSNDCEVQLNYSYQAILKQEMWALKMADATAKLNAGILDGNIYNLGSYDECLSIYNELVVGAPEDDNQLISGKYCLGTIGAKAGGGLVAAQPGIAWALCAPEKCSAADLTELISSSGMNITFTEPQCHSKSQLPEITDGDIAVICVFAVILLIMIVSSLYDIHLYYAKKETWHPLLLAFSVITNGRKLFATTVSNNSDQLSCLSGIRAISMMWIILGHTFSNILLAPLTNMFALLEYYFDGWTMYVRGATVSVDTFFLMSGIVMIYVYMKKTKADQVWFNVFLYYLHRYLRLTPALAAVLVVHITVLKHFGDGPFWGIMDHYAIANCKKYWWSVLLYVQNYVNPYEMCVGQAWYLSVDTQLFFLSPLCLIPLKRWPRITLAAVLVAACASMASAFSVAWIYKIIDMNSLANDQKSSADFMMKYYTATYARAAPWLIGIIVGYKIYNVKVATKQFRMNKVLNIVLWIVSLSIMLTCLFVDRAQDEYDRGASSAYLAFVRPAWSIALSWIIFACVTGYGGPINGFLSLPIFQILARLTYSMYITHYTIILVLYLSVKSPIEFSNINQMYDFWSTYALVFGISTLWTLAFESPIIILEKVLLGGGGGKSVKRKVEKPTNGIVNDSYVPETETSKQNV